MENRKYHGLVRRLEREASLSPAAFRWKVYALTATAWIVLLVFLAALAGLLYVLYAVGRHNAVLMFKLSLFALVLAPLFLVVLRTMFVRIPPPEGIELKRADAPPLFALLDELRRRFSGPPVHHVMVDGKFNAFITQVPRLGLFGWHRNYLVLGIPYLCAMTKAENVATIAHEYGHLVGSHGKMGTWVYRQRRTFAAVHEHVASGDDEFWANAIAKHALERFAPYFNAYTFVLSRQNEYEADAIATEVAGAAANASGLVRGTLIARWLHESFWPKFDAQADRVAQPAHMPHAALAKLVLASHAQWSRADWLAEAWKRDSDLDDTHPCLRERVEAIGETRALPPSAREVGATAFLGNATARLIAELDRKWWAGAQAGWRAHHQRVTRANARIAVLGKQPLESLKQHELHELGMMYLDVNNRVAARPVLRALLNQSGGPFPRAEYAYGCILLEEGDESGLDFLHRAAVAERGLANNCVNVACNFIAARRGDEAAQAWLDELRAALGH